MELDHLDAFPLFCQLEIYDTKVVSRIGGSVNEEHKANGMNLSCAFPIHLKPKLQSSTVDGESLTGFNNHL